MKHLFFILTVCVPLLSPPSLSRPGLSPQDHDELLRRAEAQMAEGSYELARATYAQLAGHEVPPEMARWLEFRVPDATWRSLAAANVTDPSQVEAARKQLEELVERAARPEEHDRTWAEAQESLGDFWWNTSWYRDLGSAMTRYRPAMDWWASAKDVELARTRWLAMLRRMARPTWAWEGWVPGSYGSPLPLDLLEDALEVAEEPADHAYVEYLYAASLSRQVSGPNGSLSVEKHFRAALEGGRAGESYDDALMAYAQWLESGGRWVRREDGSLQQEAEAAGALALYQRLVREFREGESAYWHQARDRARAIQAPELSVMVGSAFVPGSEVAYQLGWRNIASVQLTLVPVELVTAVRFRDPNAGAGAWLDALEVEGVPPRLSWKYDTGDRGDHRQGEARLALAEKLEPGAYVLVARSGALEQRQLVLVTDGALVVKAIGSKALVWATGAQDGAPLPGADVHLWAHAHDKQGHPFWVDRSAKTGADGVAQIELPGSAYDLELFAAMQHPRGQAFAVLSSAVETETSGWRIYACTDRPAYRPGQAVQWKTIVRRFQGTSHQTPAGETIAYTVQGPRGDEVGKGELVLDAFGGASGVLETDLKMALGPYQIAFQRRKDGAGIGSAELFRLEEYKLPDFEVRIATPEVPGLPGQRMLYVLGDVVEAEIVASLYAGGPIADASVEVVVSKRPWWRRWSPPVPYDWFDAALRPDREWNPRQYWGAEEVLRKTVTTDEAGRARVRFPTPEGGRQDLEFLIEARVTDSSRRTVTGTGNVRVTQQSYTVGVSTAHRIHAPGTAVEITFDARDANDAPVASEGTAHLLRARWVETWVGPAGEVLEDKALRARKERRGFPEIGWSCTRAEYAYEEVAKTTLSTDAKGKALWTPTPPGEGGYVARWISKDPRGGEIVGETWLYVCTPRTGDIDARSNRLDIVLDQEAVQEGERTAVMLASDVSGRHVLFTVEADGLIEWRVVRMTGRVQLLSLDVAESWVPNVFLTGTLVADGRVERAQVALTVPPVKRFLDVTVTSDRPEHKPGEEGVLEVLVRDHQGKPVQTQLALTLYDESIAAIQDELAGDLRTFFYGHARGLRVSTSSSLDWLACKKLVRTADGRVVEEEVALFDQERDKGQKEFPERERGFDGRSDMAKLSSAAPSESMAMDSLDSYEEMAGAPAARQATGGGAGAPNVIVRSDFRETALWEPALLTDAEGRATAKLRYPDSTTRWRAVVRAVDTGTRVGWVQTSPVRTSLPLVARLAAPRFFVVGDEVVISAVFDNHTDAPLTVTPHLGVEGLELEAEQQGELGARAPDVTVGPHGQGRADWRVVARTVGSARLTVTGVAGEYVDAMERTLPVREHGLDVTIFDSGRLDGEELVHAFTLPEARRAGSTRMSVRVAPSLAVTMLDALPYLVDYPYGCTEQTLSRFVPTIVAARTLADLGLSRESIVERAFGGIEAEHAAATHPKGKAAFRELDRVVTESLARLEGSQLPDGGFGWWPGGEPDSFMSAYALWALVLARDAGEDVSQAMLERAAGWLDLHLADAEQRLDLQAWMLHALAEWWRSSDGTASEFGAKAFTNLWGRRGELNAYTRALLALAAQRMGRAEDARVLARNLANGVTVEEAAGVSDIGGGAGSARARTAHWGEAGIVWRWSEGGIEATAFALRALLAIDPANELVPPVVQWLVQNRRGAQWKSTRDTSIVVLALCDYLKATGEAARDVEYEVLVNGEVVAHQKLSKQQGLSAPSEFVVASPRSGENEIRLRRLSGSGPLYWSVGATFFSEEEPIPARGGDLFVRRDAYRLVGHPTLLGGEVFERLPLAPDDEVASGDRVEIVLTVEARQDLEYLVVEDLKAAGLEAIEVQSGGDGVARELRRDELDRRFGADRTAAFQARGDRTSWPEVGTTGRERRVWRELRDAHVAYFFDQLPEGVWELRTTLTAEAPGQFHWLPPRGWAMYVPEIRANGFEARLTVGE